MKRLLKISGILLTAAVVLAFAGVLLLKKLFPPEKIKAVLLAEVSQKLNREARLGAVDIGLWSGISISDFALSEAKTFKNGTFIESEKFVLKFRLLPLLRKQVVIDRVELEKPKIRILRNADGRTFNFSDLAAPASGGRTAPEKTEAAPSQPVMLTVSEAKITAGKVEFTDRSPRKMQLELEPIDLTVTGTGLDKPMTLELSIGVRSSIAGKNLAGTLAAGAVLELPAQRVELNSLTWKMNGAVLEAKGKLQNFSKPEMDLTAALHDLDLPRLSPWIVLPKELKISGAPRAEAALKGGIENISAALSLDLTDAGVAYAGLFHKAEKTALSLSLKGAIKHQKDVTIDSLKIRAATLEGELKGEILNAPSPDTSLKLQISVPAFDVAQLAQLSRIAEPYHPAGRIGIQARATGTLKLLQADGSLQLENLSAQYEKIALGALSGKVDFTQSSLDIPKLSGKIGPAGGALPSVPAGQAGRTAGGAVSDFTLSASLKNFQRPDVSLDADFSALDLAMFLSDKKKEEAKKKEESGPAAEAQKPADKGPEIRAQGKVRLGKLTFKGFIANEAHLSWKLSGITPALNKINGVAEINTKDGKLEMKSVSFLRHLGGVLETLNKFTGSAVDPNAMLFEKITGTFSFLDGTAKTDDCRIHSPKMDIEQKGTVRLSDMDKNLLVSLKLAPGAIGGSAAQFTADSEGRPTFGFRVTGTDKNQKISLDTSVAQKKAAEELKKKGAELLQNEGKKLLENLFKR